MQPNWLDDPTLADPADVAACRCLLRGGSRSFHAASLLLPPSVRGPATALYAFCRLADDAIDLDPGCQEALGTLKQRLDDIYAGHPQPIAADRALAAVVASFPLPRALLDALLEGFAWDAEGRCYRDRSELFEYCARVAGTVGVMMALLMGVREGHLLARSADLGVAMQLTNIARDVGEDARNGRLYLPLNWMHEEGIDPQRWLAQPHFSPALGRVVRRVLDAAEWLYQQADLGIAALPLACRPGIMVARLLYAEIGHEVLRQGGDSVSRRAVVPAADKLALLGRALVSALFAQTTGRVQPVRETGFLVRAALSAIESQALRHSIRTGHTGRVPESRAAWVLDLFERLEREERRYRESVHGSRVSPRGAAVGAKRQPDPVGLLVNG